MNKESGAPSGGTKEGEGEEQDGILAAVSGKLAGMIGAAKEAIAEDNKAEQDEKVEEENKSKNQEKRNAPQSVPRRAADNLDVYNNALTEQLAQYVAQTHKFNESQIRVPGDKTKLAAELVEKSVRTGKNSLIVALATAGGMGAMKALEAMGASGTGLLAPALLAPIAAAIIKTAGSEVAASRKYRMSSALSKFDKDINSNQKAKKGAAKVIKDAPESTEKRLPQKFTNAAKFAARGRLGFATSALTRGITKEHVPIEQLVNKYKPLPIAALARTLGASVAGLAAGAAAFGIGNEIAKPFTDISRDTVDWIKYGEVPNFAKHAPVLDKGIEQFKVMLQKLFLNQ